MHLAIDMGTEGARFLFSHFVQNYSGTYVSMDILDLGRDPEALVEYLDWRVVLRSYRPLSFPEKAQKVHPDKGGGHDHIYKAERGL